MKAVSDQVRNQLKIHGMDQVFSQVMHETWRKTGNVARDLIYGHVVIQVRVPMFNRLGEL